MAANKYGAKCHDCGAWTPAGEGTIKKIDGKWHVFHAPPCPPASAAIAAPTVPEVNDVYLAGFRAGYQQAREDLEKALAQMTPTPLADAVEAEREPKRQFGPALLNAIDRDAAARKAPDPAVAAYVAEGLGEVDF